MGTFDELDDEQRISIANEHPTDLESGPSTPSSPPSYLRPRRQSKSTSRHRSHTTTDGGSSSHLLARLIARDDEVREINALLVVTSERLETESNRANTSERRALEYFNRLRQATENRERAEQDSARLREELKLYKLQLENAQKEIFRAQDIINQVSAQKNEAEAEAARARTKARKLQEEKMMMIAHEEGRRRGYKEGLSIGRRLGFDQGSTTIRYDEDPARRTHRPAVRQDEGDEEEEDESVHSERNHVRLQSRAPPRSSRHVRPESAPPVGTYEAAPHVPVLPVPILVNPVQPPSPPGRITTPSHSTGPPGETIYPTPMRPATSHSVNVPQDSWIQRADPQTSYTPIPPPRDLIRPMAPSSSTQSNELDNHSRHNSLYDVGDSNYALVRTRDYPSTQPAPIPVPRPRSPSLLSRSSTHMSQYELVSAPAERHGSSLRHEMSSTHDRSGSQPERHTSSRGGYGHERSRREDLIEQWRADPEVVATATPGTAVRDFQPMPPGPYRPIMPAPPADSRPSSRVDSHTSHVTSQKRSPPRSRNPLDYFNIRQRFQNRQSSAASVPNITVEPPSDEASTPSEHTHNSHLELLSPESAHRPLPPSHEERSRSESQSQDAHSIYRSTTPVKPQWPAGFMSIPGAPPSDSQHPRSRSRGPDEHYQMSPIPEGITYPDTPLRAQSSHGHRRSQESHYRPQESHYRPQESERSSSPAPLQRPISLFSDQDG
ncbi:uncharacterized protein EDB91DRAFT_1255604 [Suillus paluster]|uniref:uncharacterized protein n=1 Tax=Suillus paluster TaxID=48578 RepID=UPI001B871E5A|nr:uncharacterized protein EDB91DRAFT_1255604 [Suillus paluster]KAG1723533.1 hypothetical protein EDB91DRAFT_1255604 [Suillus paluster]